MKPLYRGSAADIADAVFREQPLAAHPGFDLVLKLICAEWIVLAAEGLKHVQVPAEHDGTFTDDVHAELKNWLADEARSEKLMELPFENRWNRQNLDLTDFKKYEEQFATPGSDALAERRGLTIEEREVELLLDLPPSPDIEESALDCMPSS